MAEKSGSASSYRGEILGSILAQLVLRAATGKTSCGNCVVKVHCDNKGVLSHGNSDIMRLKENQSQADALVQMRKLQEDNAVDTDYVWVKAHMKKEKGKRQTIEQKYNDMVDKIAKASINEGLETGNFVDKISVG